MIDLKKYYFSNHWNLEANSEFDGLKSRNPCTITLQINALANTYIYQHIDYPEVYPTDKGWALLKKDSWIITDWLAFGNLHQFSFGFDVFPATDKFSFEVYIKGDSHPYQTIFKFTESSIKMQHPSAYLTTSNVKALKWNKIFISYYLTHAYNWMSISICVTQLVSTGDSTNVVETSEVLVPYSYFGQTGSYVYIGFYRNGIILKNLVYFKHAVNHKYLTDLGPYRYGDDTSFNFQQNFYDGYYKYFDDKPKDFKINNASNE
jgi:hypothetical protein